MSNGKQELKTDKLLHDLMDFYKSRTAGNTYGLVRVNDYIATSHETGAQKGLYSVYNTMTEICSLVYAESEYKAIEKVMGDTIANKASTGDIYIDHVGALIV